MKNLGYYVGGFIAVLGIVLVIIDINIGRVSYGIITLCMGVIIAGITYSAKKSAKQLIEKREESLRLIKYFLLGLFFCWELIG